MVLLVECVLSGSCQLPFETGLHLLKHLGRDLQFVRCHGIGNCCHESWPRLGRPVRKLLLQVEVACDSNVHGLSELLSTSQDLSLP